MADDDRGDPPPRAALGRRRFLKIATCALGGGVGAAVAVPALGFLVDPVGKRVVTAGSEPFDAIAVDRLTAGGAPLRVPLVAPAQRDAWTSVRNVPLGSAWLRRTAGGEILALSSVCPHLGCAVGWNGPKQAFQCPCHDSAFAADGARIAGPSQRGLDPLPIEVVDGRVHITWIRYRPGGPGREPL
jgi:menaquinol-cytochrome c reductase iron-sulfur subunit